MSEKSAVYECVDREHDAWRCRACGYIENFEADGPTENGWHFCPGCGREIIVEAVNPCPFDNDNCMCQFCETPCNNGLNCSDCAHEGKAAHDELHQRVQLEREHRLPRPFMDWLPTSTPGNAKTRAGARTSSAPLGADKPSGHGLVHSRNLRGRWKDREAKRRKTFLMKRANNLFPKLVSEEMLPKEHRRSGNAA